jgi:hypothetical protein
MGKQNKSDTEKCDVVQSELAHTSYSSRNKRETHVSDANIEFVQGELALTSYQIASGGQSESDTENMEFVQGEVALSDLPAIETAKWGSKTSQIQKILMLCNLSLHLPPIK